MFLLEQERHTRVGNSIAGAICAEDAAQYADTLVNVYASASSTITAAAVPIVPTRLAAGTADDVVRSLDDVGGNASAPKSGIVARVQAKLDLYPKAIDPRTDRNINFPSGTQQRVPIADRVSWTGQDRCNFIKEWHDRGYAVPRGGWDNYDIHHILPREFGGTNDFLNLVPVEKNTHKLFNQFWREFWEL